MGVGYPIEETQRRRSWDIIGYPETLPDSAKLSFGSFGSFVGLFGSFVGLIGPLLLLIGPRLLLIGPRLLLETQALFRLNRDEQTFPSRRIPQFQFASITLEV